MFLGFSILQLLEYVAAVVITPMKRVHNQVRSRIAGLVPVRQFEQQDNRDSEADVVNSSEYHQGIELKQEYMWKNCANLPEEIIVMKQEIRELKSKMDSHVTGTSQGKEIFRNGRNQSKHTVTIKRSKILIGMPKHDP